MIEQYWPSSICISPMNQNYFCSILSLQHTHYPVHTAVYASILLMMKPIQWIAATIT